MSTKEISFESENSASESASEPLKKSDKFSVRAKKLIAEFS